MPSSLTRQGSRALTHVQSSAATLAGSVSVLWIVQIANVLTGGLLTGFGIHPRSLEGLIGILFAPLLHASFEHLLMNTISFAMLGGIMLLRDRRDFFAISAITTLGSGLGAWLLGGSGTVHIGLSGVLFGYLGFLMARGLFERSVSAVLLSALTIFAFGSMVWGVLPLAAGVSWQAHLFGFLSGVLAAARYRTSKG